LDRGFELYVLSDIPMGAGVSSSAAVELATAQLAQVLCPLYASLTKLELVQYCKQCENEFVGMGCGILDQYTSAMGKDRNLLFLDCRDLSSRYYAFDNDGTKFVLANTHAPHQLVDGKYNELREKCFAGADYFRRIKPEVTHLRDVTVKDFETHRDKLDASVRDRVEHIVTENDRVAETVAALDQDMARGLEMLGTAMSASHASSSTKFGNSCPELDAMCEAARGLKGCMGSRLMGGGFGGCTINLVRSEDAESFCQSLSERYLAKTGKKPTLLVVSPSDGAAQGLCELDAGPLSEVDDRSDVVVRNGASRRQVVQPAARRPVYVRSGPTYAAMGAAPFPAVSLSFAAPWPVRQVAQSHVVRLAKPAAQVATSRPKTSFGPHASSVISRGTGTAPYAFNPHVRRASLSSMASPLYSFRSVNVSRGVPGFLPFA